MMTSKHTVDEQIYFISDLFNVILGFEALGNKNRPRENEMVHIIIE